MEAVLTHLLRLTTDNARLREELEAARAMSHLDTARAARKGTDRPRMAHGSRRVSPLHRDRIR
jgi:hypothetical protein